MATLKRPNLEPERGITGKEFVTVQSEHQTLGISKAAMRRMDAQYGQHLHLAFDRTWAPYIGALDEQTPQGEPQINDNNSSTQCYSALFCRQLLNVLDGSVPEGESVRFPLNGDTIRDDKTGATLYKLDVPDLRE